MTSRAEQIRQYILKQVDKHANDIVKHTMQHFNVSHTTVHRHLNQLIKQHLLVKSGITKNIQYALANSFNQQRQYTITEELSEFGVLTNDFDHVLKKLPPNVYDICAYGFTEIFNNAIDHSRATTIKVFTSMSKNKLQLAIHDNGIGIFEKISKYLNLSDLRESIVQLAKGKTTTDPVNHTGEGIFFCSRAFDRFEIYANQLYYLRDNAEKDWSYQTIDKKQKGTQVIMTIDQHSATELITIFKQYQAPDSLDFDRTEILVELARIGNERLISRSQAKRIVLGLEKFTHVTLDFTGIKMVGQGFVDEVFRVYLNKHPNMTINYIHTNDDVKFMLERGIAVAKNQRSIP